MKHPSEHETLIKNRSRASSTDSTPSDYHPQRENFPIIH
jgi:hypothetical protein